MTRGARDQHECDVARKATKQSRASPRGAKVARSCAHVAGATQVHADAQVAIGGRGAGKWRAHGLVGLGLSIGAVMQ